MHQSFSARRWRTLSLTCLVSLVALFTFGAKATAQSLGDKHDRDRAKILAGYFEEWSIYYAGYDIANLQNNGVADPLTHLIYAFANVSAASLGIHWPLTYRI